MDKADIPIAMTQNDVYRCPICHRFGYASVCQTLIWFDGPKLNHNHVWSRKIREYVVFSDDVLGLEFGARHSAPANWDPSELGWHEIMKLPCNKLTSDIGQTRHHKRSKHVISWLIVAHCHLSAVLPSKNACCVSLAFLARKCQGS